MKNDPTKTRKEDNVRCRVLSGLIHKAVLEMATTCEVSQEFYDLKLEICKASAKAAACAEPLWLCCEVGMDMPEELPWLLWCVLEEFYCLASGVAECSNIRVWTTHEQSFATVIPALVPAFATLMQMQLRPIKWWFSWYNFFFLLLWHELFVLPFQEEELGFTNTSVSFQESVLAAVWELSPPCVTHQQCYWQKT